MSQKEIFGQSCRCSPRSSKIRCPLRETSGDSQQTLIDETIISSGGTHYHFDVQGALSVIGRRNEKFDDVNGDLDLSDADLRNANINDGNFRICNFFNSNLSEAWFMDSNFAAVILNVTGSLKDL